VRGEFVDIDGVRLYYYAAGSRGAGVPVVFLHGFATSGHLWSDVVSLMPPGHRLVVVDLLGHGRSDPPQGRPLSLDAHAARIVALFDALQIRTACVVGHCVGGGIAQAVALAHPARVSHLALVGSIAFGDWLPRDVMLARAAMPLLRHLPPAWLLSMVRSELERGYADADRASHALDKFGRPFLTVEGRDALRQHITALDPRETRRLAARLGELAIPATVIWGADDPVLPEALGRRLAAAIPGAAFDLIPDTRHFTPEEAPRQVSDAIARLLRR